MSVAGWIDLNDQMGPGLDDLVISMDEKKKDHKEVVNEEGKSTS
jgi:hypothetical protein